MQACHVPIDNDLQIVSVNTKYTPYQLSRIGEMGSFLLYKVFSDNSLNSKNQWIISDLENPDNINIVKKELLKGLDDLANGNILNTENMSTQAVTDMFAFIDDFDRLFDYFIKNNNVVNKISSNEKDDVDSEDDQMTEDDKKELEDRFDKAGNEDSAYSLATKNLKALFRLIPKHIYKDGKAQLYLNKEGLPVMSNYSAVWTLLLTKLSNIQNEADFKNQLNSEELLKQIPEITAIKQLLNFDNISGRKQLNQFTNFYNTFTLPTVSLKTGNFIEGFNGKLYVVQDATKSNISTISDIFTNNFFEGNFPIGMNQYIKKSPSGINILSSLPSFTNNFDDRLQFLALLGIKFSTQDSFSDEEYTHFKNEVMLISKRLYDSIQNRLTARQVITNPMSQLKQRWDSNNYHVSGESNGLFRLIQLEAKYSTIAPTLSFKNADGELQYSITLHNHLTTTTNQLNTAQSLEELFKMSAFSNAKYNPSFKNSYIINFLFDKDNNWEKRPNRKIELSNFTGTIKDGKGTSTRKISNRDKIINDFASMLQQKRVDIMRTETSSSYFMLNLWDGNKLASFTDENLFQNNFIENEEFNNKLFNYLKAEIERVNSYSQKLKENPTLPETYSVFSIFSEVLKNEDELKQNLLKEKNLNPSNKLFDTFLEKVNDYFENEGLKEYKELLSENSITNEDLMEYFPNTEKWSSLKGDGLYRAFIASNFIQNVEYSILYSGDPLFFNKKGLIDGAAEFHKRNKGLSSTGQNAANLSEITQFLKSDIVLNNYSMSAQLGVKYRDNSKTTLTRTLKEIKPITQEDSTYDFTKYPQAADAKIADGQGYINLDYWRELSIRHGVNSEESEDIYKHEMFIFKRDILGKPLTKQEERELKELSEKINKDISKYAIAIEKLMVFANHIGTENTQTGKQTPTTIDAKMYDKFSVAVLLPSMVKDKPTLKKLMLDMVKGNYGYVKYQSGSKLFSTAPVETSKLNQGDADVVSTQLIKMQIKVHSEQKTSTAIPTQLLKLIFSNLFTNGISSTEVTNLYNDYLNTLENIQKIQTKELLKDLGIKEDGSVDFNKVSSKLIAEAKRRGLNSNFIEAFAVNPDTGKLQNNLETNYNPSLAIDMIAGIADNYLRRYKLPGGDFVLLSNANQEKLANYIQTPSGTIACECRISLNKQHIKLLNAIHPDGSPIKTLNRLNQLVKGETEESKKWIVDNEKALLIILDRVPTQGANSMEFAKIVEFYPSTMGNVVTLPDEIVIKSGLDFDYDKQKTLLPALTSTGQYIRSNTEDIEKELELIKKEREGIKTELYNIAESFPEVTKKINQFREDIRTGEFFKSKPNFEDEKSIEKLKSYFTDLVNLDIAKQGLAQQLNYIKEYNNFDSEQEESFQIPNMDVHQKMKNKYEELYDEISLIQNTFRSLIEDVKNTEFKKSINNLDNFRSRIINLIEMKNQEFEGQTNNIIQQYIDTLSHPDKYEDLVIPNNTDTLKPIAENIANATQQQVALPKLGQIFMYINNLKVRDYYTTSKNMLGPFASVNPSQQVMTYSNVNVNTNYTTYFNGKSIPNKINNLLLSSKELKNVFNGKQWLMASNLDALGRSKQIINGEGISGTVDVAADPWIAFLRLNYKNIGVVNFMNIVQGVPFERIMSFINNPAIQHYTNALLSGKNKKEALTDLLRNRFQKTTSSITNSFFIDIKDPESKLEEKLKELKEDGKNDLSKLKEEKVKDGIGKMLGVKYYYTTSYDIDLVENKKQYEQFYLGLADIDSGKPISDESILQQYNSILTYSPINSEDLDKYVNVNEDRLLFKQKTLDAKSTPEYSNMVKESNKRLSDELRIFAHFYQLSNSAFVLRDLFSYFNFDKVKTATPTDINKKYQQKDKLLSTNFISQDAFQRLEKNSIISKFNNLNTINNVYKSLFTILQDDKVQTEFNKIYSANDSFLNPDRDVKNLRSLPKALNNEFLYSVIYNLAKIDGRKFGDVIKELLVKNSSTLTLAERLAEFKKQPYFNQVVSKFPVLNRIIAARYTNIGINSEIKQTDVIHNIQFIKDSIQDISEIENIKEQLQELYLNGVSPFIELYDSESEIAEKQQQAKEINEILKPLIKDIFNVGFAQNGFSNSYFSYQEFIPYNAYKDMFNEAYNKFNTLSPFQKEEYMNKFNVKFAENNPAYSNTFNMASNNIKTYNIINFKQKEISSETENTNQLPNIDLNNLDGADTTLECGK